MTAAVIIVASLIIISNRIKNIYLGSCGEGHIGTSTRRQRDISLLWPVDFVAHGDNPHACLVLSYRV